MAGSGTPWSCSPHSLLALPAPQPRIVCVCGGRVSIQPGDADESKLGDPSCSRASGWHSHVAFKASSPVLPKPGPELG